MGVVILPPGKGRENCRSNREIKLMYSYIYIGTPIGAQISFLTKHSVAPLPLEAAFPCVFCGIIQIPPEGPAASQCTFNICIVSQN